LVAAPEPPSPFAPTHYLLLETTNICIVKKPDENFGVNSIKCEKSVVSWWIRIGCKPETTAITITMSNLELAVLAKCVLDAGANPQRLLGQSTLEDHFRQATSVFHLATATDLVISPRSFETIKDKWGQITRKIERTMVEQAIEFWRNQWGLESESVRQLGMPFITDAHRSAMRNLPRPRKGCHTVESEERGRGVA
jgi:hypothetical protein